MEWCTRSLVIGEASKFQSIILSSDNNHSSNSCDLLMMMMEEEYNPCKLWRKAPLDDGGVGGVEWSSNTESSSFGASATTTSGGISQVGVV